MAKLDPPRLSIGGLSGRIYVTTHGKILGEKDGRELIESSVKYDVTEQFDALVAEQLILLLPPDQKQEGTDG